MKEKYKIITIIVSSELSPWIDIENNGIRKTWLLNKTSTDNVFFYYGGANNIKVEGDKFYSSHQEGYFNIGYKTIDILEYILNNYEFDYIFKTNTSSYIDFKELNDYIKDKPITNFFNGLIANSDNINFVSGCGVFFSKDVVETILNNKELIDHNKIEDVAISEMLSKVGIFPTKGNRFDVNYDNQDNIPNNYYHYRCKDYEKNDRNMDIVRMKKIFNIKMENHSNIIGFGAAAKGCIFLNKLNLTSDKIKYVIDDTKEKQNKYIPGTGIKIMDRSVLNETNVEYILILAHNFSDYIINSLRNDGYTGKFLILLPTIKII